MKEHVVLDQMGLAIHVHFAAAALQHQVIIADAETGGAHFPLALLGDTSPG